MTHTVGVLGINGNVGSAVIKHLLDHHRKGQIKVVAIVRPESKIAPEIKEAGIDIRKVNLDDADESVETLANKLNGIQVIVAAIAPQGIASQIKLIRALALNPDFVALLPSTYGRPYTSSEMEDPRWANTLEMFYGASRLAKEVGVGVTTVVTGAFDEYFFKLGFFGASLENNSVTASEEQQRNKFGIVTMDYLGAAIAQLVTRDPTSIKDKSFTAIDLWPTGQQLIDAFTAVNGSSPTIKDWTIAEHEAALAEGGIMATAQGYLLHWHRGDLEYPEEIVVPGYERKNIEEVVRAYKSA